MRKLLIVLAAVVSTALNAAQRPQMVYAGGGQHHVQGIVWDEAAGKMYYSFTTRFVVTDASGKVLGTVEKIHGHLGAMTFDAASRKVYASLERKADAIGANISKGLGLANYETASFLVAEIDVDKITGTDTPMEEVMVFHDIVPANEDYAANVELDGKTTEHRYGCSGIDGVAVGPAFGKKAGAPAKYLYVAYGVYGDVTRSDNDYQILLQYKLGKMDKPVAQYFVKTGNTNYGVQNMTWDPFTNQLFLAVYKGKKENYPNYTLFAVDMTSKPVKGNLEGVPYQEKKVKTLPVAGGWMFKWGSTGICALGDGYWYFSENGKVVGPDGKKLNDCKATLYKWNGKADGPFEK